MDSKSHIDTGDENNLVEELSSSSSSGDNTKGIPVSNSRVSQQDKQILRDKMKEMFSKIITDIDNQVLTVSESQCELDSQLDRLITTLDSIKIDEKLTDEIKVNAKRITSLKERLTLIHTILSNSSARCSRTLAACGTAVSSLNTPPINLQFGNNSSSSTALATTSTDTRSSMKQ